MGKIIDRVRKQQQDAGLRALLARQAQEDAKFMASECRRAAAYWGLPWWRRWMREQP